MVNIPKEYKRQVGITAERAFEKAGKLFAYKKAVEVAFLPNIPSMIIPELGIGGITTEQEGITVSIDFLRSDIKKIIRKQLPSTIYHELSHIVRGWRDVSTLLGWLVFEGIGSYVEKKLFKEKVLYVEPIQNEMRYWL